MPQWMHKGSWKIAGVMLILPQSGLVWSQEPGNEIALTESIALVQHDELSYLPQHKLDTSTVTISKATDTSAVNNEMVQIESLLNPETQLVTDPDDLANGKHIADEELANRSMPGPDEIIVSKSQRRRKINTRGVNMIKRLLWMSLFYTSSK